MHRSIGWLLGFDQRPRRTFARSPRAVPWENTLPWAIVILSQTVGADDRERASACAKAVDASTSRTVGISVIARTPNACACCGAGRRHGGRLTDARTRRSKPSMPRQNGHAVSGPHLRHKRQILLRLRPGVVTQQTFLRPLPSAPDRAAMSHR